MKVKIGIKSLVLLILVLSICASAVSAQKKQPATNQNVWQDIKFEKWGLNFSIPKDLKEIPQTEDDKPNLSDEDYSESRTFKRSKTKASRLELSIDLRNTKGEKVKTEYSGKEVELSPEDLLLLTFIGDSRNVEDADSPALEAKYHEIDGVNGVLAIINASFDAGKSVKPTNDIMVIWGTYRLFKGNVQHITFSVRGKRTQLETMKKIIDSFKLSR